MSCFSWKKTKQKNNNKKDAKLQHPSLRNELSPFLLASPKTVFGFFLCRDWWKNIYIYRTFLVTLALRHVKKLNHGRRKFAAHFRILKFHVQVMPGLCIRFSYSVFWNRKAVIRLVIFSFNLPWIDIVKKRKVICMLNDLTMLDSFSGSALFKTGLLHIWHSSLTSGFSILSYATKG